MTNRDEVMDKEPTSNGIHQRVADSCDANSTTDSNTSNARNTWFRSIPRRIRRFISKQSRYSNKQLEQVPNELTNRIISVNENVDEHDFANEGTAMTRAGIEMSR